MVRFPRTNQDHFCSFVVLCFCFLIMQVRYILLMLFGYPLALVLRHALHPSHTPLHFRYIYSLSMGLVMGFLCFHWQQMAVLVLVVLVSYLLLHLIPPTHTHRYITARIVVCLFVCCWLVGGLPRAYRLKKRACN